MSNVHPWRCVALLVSLVLASSPVRAQRAQPLLREGDTIIGLGSFLTSEVLSINDRRTWAASVAAFDATSSSRVSALVRDWFLIQRQGDPVVAPEDGFLAGWEALRVLDSGPILALAVSRVDTAARAGVYWNGSPIAVTEALADVPGLASDALWSQIRNVQGNEARVVLVSGSVRRASETALSNALVRYTLDATGNVLDRSLLTQQGVSLPVLEGDLLAKVFDSEHAIALNESGHFICQLRGITGFEVICLDLETPIATVGGPSPVPGLNWDSFAAFPRCDLNDLGEYVFAASTEDPEDPESELYTVVKNGEVLAAEGMVLPAFSESGLGKGSSSPILIANSGDVFWWAKTLEDGGERAYLRNLVPILQEGVTEVGNDLVRSVSSASDAFAISDDGRFWIGSAQLEDAGEAILFLDFGLTVPIPGCGGNPGVLRKGEGEARVGETLRLELAAGQAVGVRPVLHLSTSPRLPGSPCGVSSPYGEILISAPGRFARFLLPPWEGAPVGVDLDIPSDPALIDATFYAQGAFWDQGNQSPAPDYWLTNALRIELGAP